DGDQRGVGGREVPDLVERGGGAVVVDLDPIQHRQRGAARAHGGQLAPHRFHRGVHPLPRVRDEILDRHGYSFTMVPTFLPVRIFLSPPFCLRLYTMMGRPLSMQSEMAVVSMTFRPFWRTSK